MIIQSLARKACLSLTLGASILLGLNGDTRAQLAETWNVQSRQQAESLTSAGTSLIQRGDLTGAIVDFQKATSVDPADARPFKALALALTIQGKYDEALHVLKRAHALQPSSETLLTTGIVYYLQQDYEAATNAWQRALQMKPKVWELYGDLGFAALRQGQFSLAEENFEKLVKHKPASSLGYQGLALAQYMKGDFRAARSSAERSLALLDYAPTKLLLARLDALQGDRNTALKRALEVAGAGKKNPIIRSMTELGYPLQSDFRWDPFMVDTHDNAYLFAARLQGPAQAKKQASLAAQGNAAENIAALQTKLKRSPKDIFLNRELALVLLANGQYKEAASVFKDLLDTCPHANVDYLHAGLATALAGDSNEGSGFISVFRQKLPAQKISPAFMNIGTEPAPQQTAIKKEKPPAPVKKEKPQPAVKKEKQPKSVKPAKLKNNGEKSKHLPQSAPAAEQAIPASEF